LTVTTLVERLDLPAALSRARSRSDTETDTSSVYAGLARRGQAKGLQLAARARYAPACCRLSIQVGTSFYNLVLLGLFALIGWCQVRLGGLACRGQSLRCCSATSRC
jgi:adenylate cyclase